jgi:hypothetical protein
VFNRVWKLFFKPSLLYTLINNFFKNYNSKPSLQLLQPVYFLHAQTIITLLNYNFGNLAVEFDNVFEFSQSNFRFINKPHITTRKSKITDVKCISLATSLALLGDNIKSVLHRVAEHWCAFTSSGTKYSAANYWYRTLVSMKHNNAGRNRSRRFLYAHPQSEHGWTWAQVTSTFYSREISRFSNSFQAEPFFYSSYRESGANYSITRSL